MRTLVMSIGHVPSPSPMKDCASTAAARASSGNNNRRLRGAFGAFEARVVGDDGDGGGGAREGAATGLALR